MFTGAASMGMVVFNGDDVVKEMNERKREGIPPALPPQEFNGALGWMMMRIVAWHVATIFDAIPRANFASRLGLTWSDIGTRPKHGR